MHRGHGPRQTRRRGGPSAGRSAFVRSTDGPLGGRGDGFAPAGQWPAKRKTRQGARSLRFSVAARGPRLITFFDASALVKRYVDESGTRAIRSLFSARRFRPAVSRLSAVEVPAALARRSLPGDEPDRVARA